MKFTGVIEERDSKIWSCHVLVPEKVIVEVKKWGSKRVVCTLNGKVKFQCAVLPRGDGQYFVSVNKANRKALGVIEGMSVTVELEKDESEYGLPVPEEFIEILKQDPEGDKAFHGLTKGKQRSLLYIIAKPKSSQLRINKALVILDYLKYAKGKLDFRELMQALKNANKR